MRIRKRNVGAVVGVSLLSGLLASVAFGAQFDVYDGPDGCVTGIATLSEGNGHLNTHSETFSKDHGCSSPKQKDAGKIFVEHLTYKDSSSGLNLCGPTPYALNENPNVNKTIEKERDCGQGNYFQVAYAQVYINGIFRPTSGYGVSSNPKYCNSC